jgi:hypothetical protein
VAEVAKGMVDAEAGEGLAGAGVVIEGRGGSMEVQAVQAVVVLGWAAEVVAMGEADWVATVVAVEVEFQVAAAEAGAAEAEVGGEVCLADPATALAVVVTAKAVVAEDAALRSRRASQRFPAARRRRGHRWL